MIPNRCIIVLGMHRSGTSALTGVLSLLGINPGNSLLPPMEDVNPKGFWEHKEIVAIHEQLLSALESSWYDENTLPDQWWLTPLARSFRERIVDVLRRDFSDQPIWLVKDPRMCRLLPLWQEVFSDLGCQPRYILSIRNPAEVARSLGKRDELTEEASCLLWLIHMLEAEYHTRGQPRAFVNYENLLTDWKGAMTSVGETLGIAWPVTMADAAPDIESFLDPSLRHHSDIEPLSGHPACQLAQKAFTLLTSEHPDLMKLDRMRAQTGEFVNLIAPYSKRLRYSKMQVHSLEAAIANLEWKTTSQHSEIIRIKSSVSWQITKPLRFIWNTLSQLLFHRP